MYKQKPPWQFADVTDLLLPPLPSRPSREVTGKNQHIATPSRQRPARSDGEIRDHLRLELTRVVIYANGNDGKHMWQVHILTLKLFIGRIINATTIDQHLHIVTLFKTNISLGMWFNLWRQVEWPAGKPNSQFFLQPTQRSFSSS